MEGWSPRTIPPVWVDDRKWKRQRNVTSLHARGTVGDHEHSLRKLLVPAVDVNTLRASRSWCSKVEKLLDRQDTLVVQEESGVISRAQGVTTGCEPLNPSRAKPGGATWGDGRRGIGAEGGPMKGRGRPGRGLAQEVAPGRGRPIRRPNSWALRQALRGPSAPQRPSSHSRPLRQYGSQPSALGLPALALRPHSSSMFLPRA